MAVMAATAVIAVLICAALTLSVGGGISRAQGQTPDVTASVDRTDLSISDAVTLTLEIRGHLNVALPTPPFVPGLQLIGSARSSSTGFDNGRLSAVFEFQFTYQPTRTGTIEIEPIKVILDNVVHLTAPITVNVTAGGQQPLQVSPGISQPTSLVGQDFFSEAFVDDESPYLGQQITYTLRLYSTNPTSRPIRDPPDFAGFWNPGRTRLDQSGVAVSGRRYTLTEEETILFPTLVGQTNIESTGVSVAGGFFASGRTDFRTQPIALNVSPLPPNEPDAFTGAVGKFDISADVNANSVAIGEPVTVTLTVSGEGNIETLPGPAWPDVAGWRGFDGDTDHAIRVVNGKLQGRKTFKRALLPDFAGSYELPAIEYAYFDPDTEEYVTRSTPTFRIEVASDRNAEPIVPSITTPHDEETAQEVRHIKATPGSLARPGGSLASSPVFWSLWLAPLAIVVLMASRMTIARRGRAGASRSDEPSAGQAALARLTTVEPGAPAHDVAGVALHSYLSAVLKISTGGLPLSEIVRHLHTRGVSHETTALLTRTLSRIDEMRFAPPHSTDSSEVNREVAAVVDRLDEELTE